MFEESDLTEPKIREPVVKSTDMDEQMQQEAIQVANDALNKFKVEKDMATYIKEEFDKKYSPSWHCVVGRNFGSYVTHETNHFIYFYLQHIAIMLFKTAF
uniref:Dynein light chain n=1 Tax=Syphacia muris TaxID=451379 RepID=A0A0N5AQV5_9BILA